MVVVVKQAVDLLDVYSCRKKINNYCGTGCQCQQYINLPTEQNQQIQYNCISESETDSSSSEDS